MNLNPKQLIILSAIGLVFSLIIHLIAISDWYQVSNTIIMILTAGILLVWLQSSKNLKVLHKAYPDQHPWKTVFTIGPEWAKYLLYFFIFYAVLNFALMMSFGSSNNYLNFEVSQSKLRGLSGFWMAFYALGLVFGYALNIHLKNFQEESDKS
ncbi:MAG: hypothetical protein JW956_13755 [Calditrichaceae bacterium]|nr:hypothetical protein [Calditrichaceae bacterium]